MNESTIEVRDSREPGHFWADNEIIDDYGPQIGVYGLGVYMVLARYANSSTGQSFPSLATIGKKLAISRSSVIRALDKLQEVGLIHIEQRTTGQPGHEYYQTSVYTLLKVQPRRPQPVNDGEQGGWSPTDTTPSIPQTPGWSPTDTRVVSVRHLNNTKLTRLNEQDSGDPDSENEEIALKGKRSPHQLMMEAYSDSLGYTIPDGARTGKTAKQLVQRGVSPDDVRACYAYLKGDPFWHGKHLPLETIAREIGAWIQAGRPTHRAGSRAAPPPASPPEAAPTPAFDERMVEYWRSRVSDEDKELFG